MKKKLCFLTLILTFALSLFVTFAVSNVSAEENGVIYVHFYNGSGEYDNPDWNGKSVVWGAYYWIDTGRVVAAQSPDTEFAKEDNVGQLFKIQLNASETKAVNQGKKLGLIMVRSYIDELGYLTPYWYGNAGKDLSSDRYIDVKLNGSNEFNLWIIAGDKNNYTSLEQAKSAFERIEGANFDDFDTVIIQTTKAITTSTEIKIYKNAERGIDSDESDLGELINTVHASYIWNEGKGAKITGLGLGSTFDWNADYSILIEDVSVFATNICKTRLYLSDKFKTECIAPNDTVFGATYTPNRTTFRVWAPISTAVYVNFYKEGNELDTTLKRPTEAMTKTTKGCWELTVDADLNGVYYTYTNCVGGEKNETVDIYATAVGVNGNRAMVCDLSRTNPDNWGSDLANAQAIRQVREDDPCAGVIWEVHVRDFSIAADSGITQKGKYLAFTEEGTTVKGTSIKTGIDYLKDLGITYVHLNPVYDFATVDEEYINNTDYTTKQNWGYDPKNYNVPEGSYATDAVHANVRITEFKQMVQALHNAGIGVIMDVVYNHTYTADSYFEKMVPGYYYRQAIAWEDGSRKAGTFNSADWKLNALGSYELADGSGCSNETASERQMYREYMCDSLYYWASEYHVDGFRFDLMAIHDVTTMNAIRDRLDTLPGGRGIVLYGEPWSLGCEIDPATGEKSACSDNLNDLNSRIAAFNDRMREGIKGNNDGGKGYVQNEVNEGVLNRVKAGINGYFLKYDQSGIISNAPSHTITYTTSHDNYTLWDQLISTTVKEKSPTLYSERNAVIEKKNMMAATLTLTSRGTAFMLAGEEIARTKYGNHNSYNAQDKVNAFDYGRVDEFSKLYNWYKGLIDIRTNRFKTITKGSDEATVNNHNNTLMYVYDRKVTGDEYSKLAVIMNPTASSDAIEWNGTWTLLGDGNEINFSSTKTVGDGSITIPAYTTYIIVQK
ncbi:MAG: hypothetical protein IJU60_05685 [Acholeplasmatales bacterium]|nr:hypothetical protein [Acholeplasmatales bacterium]